jgi:phosphate transport system protein
MGIVMIEHTTRAFDADLQSLALQIAEMSRLDETQIRQSIEALAKGDVALAKRVIAAHERVDALQREIEEKAIVTIARRQPMAVDLRDIIGALRISNDLERIGDLAENVAKEVVLLADAFCIEEAVLQFQRMARLVLVQLMRVLQSYERRDSAAAVEVWLNDLPPAGCPAGAGDGADGTAAYPVARRPVRRLCGVIPSRLFTSGVKRP